MSTETNAEGYKKVLSLEPTAEMKWQLQPADDLRASVFEEL